MGPAESRLILDQAGADELLGHGDMLYKAPHDSELQRVQGILVSQAERMRIIDFWKN
jgi:S-DNA-T family DNA segregation ATPase FtsK/SpoIIIE